MEKIKTDYKRRNWNLRLQLSTWANREEARAIVYFLRRLLSHCFFRYPKKEKSRNIVFILQFISIGWQGSVDLEKFANPEWNLSCTCRTEYDYSLVCLKALANEDTLLRTHCCRHKCLPVCLRAQLLLQILCPGHKKCFWFSEIFCVRNTCFPVCAAQETSWATMCPQKCVLVYQGLELCEIL